MVDIELQELAADRLCKDYDGCVDIEERDLFTSFGNHVDRLTYEKGKIHYWSRYGERYDEIFPNDKDANYILDEFYAWY